MSNHNHPILDKDFGVCTFRLKEDTNLKSMGLPEKVLNKDLRLVSIHQRHLFPVIQFVIIDDKEDKKYFATYCSAKRESVLKIKI